jgi:adenine phosphoribosyltransferase
MTVNDTELADAIRSIPDYPKPGIIFRDITTLLSDGAAYSKAVELLTAPLRDLKIDKIVGLEARGFIFGGAVARELGIGFVPVRKKGKLPREVVSISYALEYGEDVMEMHVDAVEKGERVIVIDDLIATGGTAEAAIKLLQRQGAEVVGASFVIDLPDLGGKEKLVALGAEVRTLVEFPGH